jgi:hypothetical protein
MLSRHFISITIGLFLIFNSYNFRKKNNAIIKFNSGSQSISDKNILENLLNRYVYINNYFCDNKLKDYIQDSICKYDLNKFSKFTNYKQAEIMINILYKSNSIICMNIIEFYDLKKQHIDLHKVEEYCNEFQATYSNINTYLCLNYIYKFFFNYLNLSMIISAYIHIYNNYVLQKFKLKKSIKNIINKIKYSPDLDICSICHDPYTHESIDITQLKSCRHIYHYNCIKEWLVTHKHTNCPLCNKNVVHSN